MTLFRSLCHPSIQLDTHQHYNSLLHHFGPGCSAPASFITDLPAICAGPAGCSENNCINHSFCWRLTDPTGDNLCCTQLFQRSQWEVVFCFWTTHNEGLGIILETEKESGSGGLKRRKGWTDLYTQKKNMSSKLFTKEFTASAVWLKQALTGVGCINPNTHLGTRFPLTQ